MPGATARRLFLLDKHSDVKVESKDIFCATAKVLNSYFYKFTILKPEDWWNPQGFPVYVPLKTASGKWCVKKKKDPLI